MIFRCLNDLEIPAGCSSCPVTGSAAHCLAPLSSGCRSPGRSLKLQLTNHQALPRSFLSPAAVSFFPSLSRSLKLLLANTVKQGNLSEASLLSPTAVVAFLPSVPPAGHCSCCSSPTTNAVKQGSNFLTVINWSCTLKRAWTFEEHQFAPFVEYFR